MELVKSLYMYFSQNGASIGATATAIYVAAELITRLTPTKKDDSFLSRAGSFVKKVLDLLKVPNNIKVSEVKEEQK